MAVVCLLGRIETLSIVLHHRLDGALPPRQQDADPARPRVLDDVRERFLDDSIESRLDLFGQPLVGERRLEVDRDPGLLGEGVGEPFEGGDQAEVVKRTRAQLDGQPADVLERRDDELAQLLGGGP